MPRPTAILFRPGRRSHRGRPGRRGSRSRFRVGFAERSAFPASAARRSRTRRARAASARASAWATSSSASVSEACATAPESTPERDCGSSRSVTFVGPPQSSASGPSGSCTEKQLITSAWAQRPSLAETFVVLTCGNGRLSGEGRSGVRGGLARAVVIARAIFSNQENFLFRCGKVIGCD